MIVFVRTKQATEELAEKLRARGLLRRRDQRRHPAGAARAHHRPAEGRQARHPGRHRRRRARPRRRADQPRAQLRHPARHRVLRAPHRPHRPRRPQRRRDLCSSRRASATCSRRSSGRPARRSTEMQLPTRRGRQRHAGRPGSTTRSPRRSSTDRIDFFRDVDRGLRARARRARGRHRGRAGGRAPGRRAAAARPEPVRPARTSTTAGDARPSADATGDRGDRGDRGERGDRGPRRGRPARWRPTGSRSASGTRSSRARSSARSPTRAASAGSDFGHIDIRADHSLVELPADLPPGTLGQAARRPASPASSSS